MLTFDLKTLLVTLILLLIVAVAVGYWLARRRARPTIALPDGGPFGVAALEGRQWNQMPAMADSVLACVGEFGSVLVSAFRLNSGQVRPAPSLLGVQTATVVLWALKRPKHPGN